MSKQPRLQSGIRLIITIACVFVALAAPRAFAETVNNSTNTLKLSPVRSDIEAKPGSTVTVDATITNLTNTAIAVRPVLNDFIAGDERGTPSLILDENQYAPTHSLKRFMEPLSDITVPANDAKIVQVVINVPDTAQAGGYFGAVRFAPVTTDGSGQVNMSASAASIILLTVPGEFVEQLSLTEMNIQQNGVTKTNFRSSNDLQATVRFENKGNIQLGPFGKVSVTSGDKVVYEADFNNSNPREMVLPDSARRWDVPLKNIGNFGKYTVSATFTYGTKNQSIEVTKSFWVIPWNIILWSVAGVLLLVGIIVAIWLGLRNYKRRIINSSSSRRRRY